MLKTKFATSGMNSIVQSEKAPSNVCEHYTHPRSVIRVLDLIIKFKFKIDLFYFDCT